MEVQSLIINGNCNATESSAKVKRCFFNLIPSFEESNFSTTTVTGGYGNPITTMEYHSSNSVINKVILEHIALSLSLQDKLQLAEELDRRIDTKGVLFIRFSKRDLYQNKLILSSQSDSFRILVRFSFHSHRFDIKKNFNELNEFLNSIGIIAS